MPIMMKRGEGAKEQNDTVFIEKGDGGFSVFKDAYLEGGLLHINEAGWSFRPLTGAHKIPVYQFNRLGQPPTQAQLIYYMDEEPIDPLLDQQFLNNVLPNTFLAGQEGRLRYDKDDRKRRQNANFIFGLAGALIILGTILTNSAACGPDVHVVREQIVAPAAEGG